MDYIPYLVATTAGAISVEVINNRKKKNSQINNDFDFSEFELEDAEILTDKKIEEYTKINKSKN